MLIEVVSQSNFESDKFDFQTLEVTCKSQKGGGISHTNTCMHKIKGLLKQSIKAKSMAHILIEISQNFRYCINQSTTSTVQGKGRINYGNSITKTDL